MLDDAPLCPHCRRPLLSRKALGVLNYMKREAPKRGGYMFEGARPPYEQGTYLDAELKELLSLQAIAPHSDPAKGWVTVW